MTPIDLGSQGQRSTSQGPLMSEWFLLIILKSILYKVFIFHIVIGHNSVMTPIDFRVTSSKVKVTGALNVRIVSAHYLGYNSSQSLLISHIDWL
jgi:hypothetical protein